jgi:hypothetical protein
MALATADTVPDLRTRTGAASDSVLLLGYHAEGDGGGGLFYWTNDTLTADDGGVVIVPTELARTGCWKRLIHGLLSVRWFGARGDGVTLDQEPIQKTIDFVAFGAPPFVHGNTVLVPPGKYRLQAAAGHAALVIKNNNVNLVGTGAPPYGSQLFVSGPGSAILIDAPIEDPAAHPTTTMARGSEIRNLSIYGDPNSKPEDGIVVHAPGVCISDCFIATTARHGLLIESAWDEPGGGSPPLGVTTTVGKQLNAQACRVWNVFCETCGNYGSNGDPSEGAAIYIHGNNTNGSVFVGAFAQSCNVGHVDGSLGGATWVGCYSEGGHAGFVNASAGAATYVGCTSEDTSEATFPGPAGTGSIATLAVGGSICAKPWGAPQRIGQLTAELIFSRTALNPPTPVEYGARIPGHEGFNSALDISRNGSTWSFAYEPSVVTWPFQQAGWRLFHSLNGVGDVAVDQFGGPFGWTDSGNPRGAGLPFISNPLMNSHRHWSYKEAVMLQPGTNIVHLCGGGRDGGAVAFLDGATDFWSNAQSRLTIDLEFDSVDALADSDVRVVGYAFEPEALGRNAAAKIVNAGETATVVTVVWHFETFVTNYDDSPG